MKLTFGIDFDDTWTADVRLFAAITKLIQEAGHTVVIVTARGDTMYWDSHQVKETVGDLPIVFSNMQRKDDAASSAGYEVDIWIDDCPEFIRTSRGEAQGGVHKSSIEEIARNES